jgi:hypothetical protein
MMPPIAAMPNVLSFPFTRFSFRLPFRYFLGLVARPPLHDQHRKDGLITPPEGGEERWANPVTVRPTAFRSSASGRRARTQSPRVAERACSSLLLLTHLRHEGCYRDPLGFVSYSASARGMSPSSRLRKTVFSS